MLCLEKPYSFSPASLYLNLLKFFFYSFIVETFFFVHLETVRLSDTCHFCQPSDWKTFCWESSWWKCLLRWKHQESSFSHSRLRGRRFQRGLHPCSLQVLRYLLQHVHVSLGSLLQFHSHLDKHLFRSHWHRTFPALTALCTNRCTNLRLPQAKLWCVSCWAADHSLPKCPNQQLGHLR